MPAHTCDLTPPIEALTAYEIRIGRSVAEEASDADIAALLAISPCALDHHLRPICKKIGVESRTQLAAVFGKLAREDDGGG